MPFVYDLTETVTSFAEYSDVLETDMRVFQNNEGLTDSVIEELLPKSTDRILYQIKYSDWWRDLYLKTTTNPQFNNPSDVPDVDPNKIVLRKSDFTDLCVFHCLYYYILPKVADFTTQDNAERAKIGFYQAKYQLLFTELINNGDWYDVDGNGSISSREKNPGNYRLHRVR